MAALTAENLAFAPNEARLSNLIESVPALRNPVTGYLQADAGDVGAEAVLKQNLEALGMGVLASPLVMALGKFKDGGKVAIRWLREGPELTGRARTLLHGSDQPVKVGMDTWTIGDPGTDRGVITRMSGGSTRGLPVRAGAGLSEKFVLTQGRDVDSFESLAAARATYNQWRADQVKLIHRAENRCGGISAGSSVSLRFSLLADGFHLCGAL